MKVLVTGATGFVGQRLFNKVKKVGLDAVGISRCEEDDRAGILMVDITKRKELSELFSKEKFDLVFHLAAYIPKNHDKLSAGEIYKCFDINTLGTINLLEAGAKYGVRRFVYVSSASVYSAEPKKFPVTEEDVEPRNFYGESKLLAELYVSKYARENSFSYSCLRYSSVYGPGQKRNSVLPLFVDTARAGGVLKVFGSGNRSQDFVFVDDAADATLLAGQNKISGIYNIGSGRETTMIELAETIVSVVGKGTIKFVPEPDGIQKNDVRFYLDISRAKRKLKYLPKYALKDGIGLMNRYLLTK